MRQQSEASLFKGGWKTEEAGFKWSFDTCPGRHWECLLYPKDDIPDPRIYDRNAATPDNNVLLSRVLQRLISAAAKGEALSSIRL